MGSGDEHAYASTVGGDEVGAAVEIGRELAGRYVLRRLLGRGGFGVVYEAEDLRLEKRVAVKLLTGELQKRPDALGRFKQEAIAAARIGHHGIIDVTDFDQDVDGTHFIVMELIDGVDLALTLQAGAMPLARALTIAARVAQTLAQAHARGIVHRDLKPANIMLTSIGGVEDVVKVLDFGISKVLTVEQDVSVTATGNFVGTPKYMAPEQGLGGKPIDGRADIYALGGILYEMVTGSPPYEGSSHYELIHNKLTFAARPPSLFVTHEELPLAFDRLVLQALERDLDARFQSMAELDLAIRELLLKVEPSAAALVRPSTPIPRPAPPPLDGAGRTPSQRPTPPVSAVTKVIAPQRRSAAAQATATPSGAERAPTPAPTPATASVVVAEPTRRSRGLVAVVGAIALMAAAAAIVFAVTRSPGAAAPTTPAPQAVPVAREAPAPAAPAPAPQPDLVELRLVLQPASARVELDGVVVTDNPVRLPRSGDMHTLVVSAPGRRSETLSIPASNSRIVTLELQAAPAKRPARGRRPARDTRLPDAPL